MLQNGQMTDFCETVDQLQLKLSLELNVIETKSFSADTVNTIVLGIR